MRIRIQSTATAHFDNAGHRAFSLIEVLMVTAIIGVLFSLIGVAVMSSINSARIAATKGTLVKIQGLIQQRVDSLRMKDLDENYVRLLRDRNFAGNDKRARAIVEKIRFRQAFPQTWSEIETYYPQLLKGHDFPPKDKRKDATESSEVLLFILTKANVLGYPPEGSDTFTSSELKDTDLPPNGTLELVDAWGSPLRFYRWPTRLIRGGPYTATGGFSASDVAVARSLIPSLPTTIGDMAKDSDDKFGLLKAKSNWQPVFGNNIYQLPQAHIDYFEQGEAPAPSSSSASPFYGLYAFHTLETFSLPLVVSAGPDRVTGLYEPSSYGDFGYLGRVNSSLVSNVYDNLTNYNIRSGGK